MKIYNSIVSWIIKKRIHHIELFINYPHEVQEELRHSLIHKAKNTEFGICFFLNSSSASKPVSGRKNVASNIFTFGFSLLLFTTLGSMNKELFKFHLHLQPVRKH